MSNSNGNTRHNRTSLSDDHELQSPTSNDNDSTSIAESASDELPTDGQQMTSIVYFMNTCLFHRLDILDQEINSLILFSSYLTIDEIIKSIQYGFMMILFWFIIYQYYELLLLIYTIYKLMNHQTRYDEQINRIQLHYANIHISHLLNLDRDAQAEGRTANPVDEVVLSMFSTVVTSVDIEPTGIEDTQPHDAGVLVGINNNRPTYCIPNNETAHENEEAASLNNGDNSISDPLPEIGANAQVQHNGDVPETATDDSTCNINPQRSIESHDGVQRINNNREPDQTITSNQQSDQKNVFNGQQQNTTNTGVINNEVVEPQRNISNPVNDAQPIIENAVCIARMLNHKPTVLIDTTSESSDESVD
ncbi:unnamed protein product [Rotaria magnacalcarata]|uniref:Uncharacterized protein n=1 Tax=Rotaria magnacalcarata TaxID=392030 RepID=A0A8S2INC5_9BILA|nr:unnamed protein product [Rotaria magnacalcarata]